MLKIGQNWGKIANYAPNAQQRFAPLKTTFLLNGDFLELLLHIDYYFITSQFISNYQQSAMSKIIFDFNNKSIKMFLT